MRLALLTRAAHPLHGPGGLERAVFLLATHLGRGGARVRLFTRPPEHAGEFPGEVETCAYGRLPGLRHGRVLDRTLLYPAFARRLGAACARHVRAGDVDVVHAEGVAGWGYARLRRAEPSLNAPLVVNPQGMEEHRARGWKRLALGRLRRLSRQTAAAAARVIATDAATRDDVPRLLGVAPERVVVLPNGIDLQDLEARSPADPAAAVRNAHPRLADAAPLLLSVGRLEAYKGFEETRAALERLDAQGVLGERWAWAVVGQGPLAARLDAGPIGTRVHLLGHADDSLLHALYARADVFIHATRFEGSSLVTLEAMAHRAAIVATRAGGIPDKILDGETGLLADPGDVAGLAAALHRMLGFADRRARFGENARRHVAEHFDWRVLAPRWRALYDDVAREARA